MTDIREIIWVDSGQQMASTWTSEELVIARAKELDTTVNTVGHVIEWNDEFVLVAQSIDNENGMVAGVMRITQDSIRTINIPKELE